jgi:hypothetical protein
MTRWIPPVFLVFLLPAAFAAGAEKVQPLTATRSAPVLEVSTFMREIDKQKGVVRVEGIVSAVFVKEQKLGLIDAAEFRRCGVVTCADMVLPVQWKGPMPEVKSLVRLEGVIRKNGEKLEFVAKSLEKVPAK